MTGREVLIQHVIACIVGEGVFPEADCTLCDELTAMSVDEQDAFMAEVSEAYLAQTTT